MAGTPQRFTPRAGSGLPGRVRRSLDGGAESTQRFNGSLAVDKDGRLGAKLSKDSGLEMTRDGLRVSPQVLGDKNREQMDRIADLETSATAATIVSKVNELLAELRRTRRVRGTA